MIRFIFSTHLTELKSYLQPTDQIIMKSLYHKLYKARGVSRSKANPGTKKRIKLRRHPPVLLLHAVDAEDDQVNQDDTFMPTRRVAKNRAYLLPKENTMLEHGFAKHWKSVVGGSHTDIATTTALRITVKFLARVFEFALDNGIVFEERLTIFEFFVRLVCDAALFKSLTDFVAVYPGQPGTIASHLYTIQDSARWLTFNHLARESDDFVPGMSRFTAYIASAIRGAKRTTARQQKNKDMSVDTAVFEGRFPPGGFDELRALVHEDVADMEAAFSSDKPTPEITEILFNRLLQLIMVLFWLTAPQGRVEGIQTLRLAHLEEFRQQGFALNRKFKTAATYKYQPVVISDAVKKLLAIWVTVVRPTVLAPHAVEHRDDFVWLSYEGTAVTNVSARVVRYFRDRRGWKITTTQLRSLLETDMARRHADGEITDAERVAVSVVSGHSGSTADEYYVRTDMAANVARARNAFGLPAVLPITADLPVVPLPVVDVWGVNHPDRDKTEGRAEWTVEEKDYLADLMTQIQGEHSHAYEGQIMSECLRRIRADRASRLIFHPR